MMKINRFSPKVQNTIVAGVGFLAVGIYAAVLGLGAGGGGPDAVHVNNIVAAVFYGVFGVTGTFGGSTLNTIGPRYALMLGAFGYPFYITGLWYFDYSGSPVYPIIGGAVGGYSAGLMWTVSNFVAFGYAAEHEKGIFFTIQNAAFTGGTFLGSTVVLGITYSDSSISKVPQSVYATFFSVMMLSVPLAWLMCKPEEVRRDGEPIAIFKNESFWHETKGIVDLFRDLRTWLLFPLLLFNEIPVTLQPNISAYWFDVRTRSLAVCTGTIFSIMGLFILQFILDSEKLSRKARAYAGFALVFTMLCAAYGGELGWMYTRPSGTFTKANGVDWTDSGFAGCFVLLMIFNISNAMTPMYISWMIMTFTNEPKRVGRYAGLIKGGTASGIAIMFGIAASGTVALEHQSIIQGACQIGSMLPILYLIAKYITSTNYEVEKDVVFIPPHEAGILHLDVPLHPTEIVQSEAPKATQ